VFSCVLFARLDQNRRNVLLTGETGTGKTVNITNMLQFELGDSYLPLVLTFSARTSANQTQDLIGECVLPECWVSLQENQCHALCGL
jgi:hypothetical protein